MLHSDIELLRASRAGQPEAFGRLVARYQSMVCAVAFSATGDVALSEDLAQEAFVTAWNKLGELRDNHRFPGWVCGIVRNLARYSRRHQRRHAPAATESVDRLVELPSAGPSPLDQAIARQQVELVWRALRDIPVTYREPIVLFYREQKSLKQVAEALDLSEDTVKQRLSRGRKQLKRGVADLLERALEATRSRKDLSAAVLVLISLPVGKAAAAATGTKAMLGSGLGAKSLALAGGAVMAAAAAAVIAVWPSGSADVATVAPVAVALPATPGDREAATPEPDAHVAPTAVVKLGAATVHAARSSASPPAVAKPRARLQPRRPSVTAVELVTEPTRDSASQTGIVIERGPTSVGRAGRSVGPSISLSEIVDLAPLDPPWHDDRDVDADHPSAGLPISPPDLRARIGNIDL